MHSGPGSQKKRVFPANSRGYNPGSLSTMIQDKRLLALIFVIGGLLLYVTFRPIPSPPGNLRQGGLKRERAGSNFPDAGESQATETSTDTRPSSPIKNEEKDGDDELNMHSELPVVTEKYDPGPKKPLNPPHGGELVDLMASAARAEELKTEVAPKLVSWTLSSRQLCDLELLTNGGFSPLDGFMDEKEYNEVLENLHLSERYNNLLWPMPITLDVTEDFASGVEKGTKLALRDEFFNLIAVMEVSDKYVPNKENEAIKVFRTSDRSHPAVDYLFNQAGSVYLGGKFETVQYPIHYDFPEFRRSPRELRQHVESMGWSRFLAFQTRNPMHRAHIELTRLVQSEHDVGVILHPSVGMTKPGDVAHYVRIRCYKAIIESNRYYLRNGVDLSLLHLAMRMGGPREAVWHALIRKNHGASHFLIGRDHAGCKSADGEDFYGPYDAQDLAFKYEKELGIELVRFKKVVYVPALDKYLPEDRLPEGAKTLSLSGTQFRAMMNAGSPIPAWFSDPEVIRILQEVHPPKHKRGFAIFFTGLSGGGKTTVSQALLSRIKELLPTRHITMLDGDIARTHLTAELGFSVNDRNINVARMGYVASEAVRHTGIVIAATISPFEKARQESRRLVDDAGGRFILVQVSTSVDTCAARDVKGLYAMGRERKIALTGVSHPYEQPEEADIIVNGEVVPIETSADMVLAWLYKEGYLTKDNVGPSIASMNLKNDGVLASYEPDAGSRNCILYPGGTAGSKQPRLTFLVSSSSDAKIDSLKNKFSFDTENQGVILEVTEKTFLELAKEHVENRFMEIARRRGKDAAHVTDIMSSFVEDDKPETAFDIWRSARVAAVSGQTEITGKEDVPANMDIIKTVTSMEGAPQTAVVVLPPQAISILPNLLRIDPCAMAIIGNVDAENSNSHGEANGLQDRFPSRVALADAEGQTIEPSDEKTSYPSVESIRKSMIGE